MELSPHIETVQHHLEVAADAGGEDARALARRLVAPLDASIRLAFQDVLAAAAEEITLELAPGSVEVRLRGRDPEFVVTPPPADPLDEVTDDDDDMSWATSARADLGEGDEMSRINLRLAEHLKTRIEAAAVAEGLSVNAWLVRAAAAAVDRNDAPRRRERRAPHGAQRFTGWAR